MMATQHAPPAHADPCPSPKADGPAPRYLYGAGLALLHAADAHRTTAGGERLPFYTSRLLRNSLRRFDLLPTEMNKERLPVYAARIRGAKAGGGDSRDALAAARRVRRMISVEQAPPLDEVIATNILPDLRDILGQPLQYAVELQVESAWIVVNICGGSTVHCQEIVNGGMVPLLVQLTSEGWYEVTEHAVWALGNIAGDNVQMRDYCLAHGALGALVNAAQVATQQPEELGLETLRKAVWGISNLCRGKPSPPLPMLAPCVPLLATAITHKDEECKADALWAVSYVSDGNNDRIQVVINAGMIPIILSNIPSRGQLLSPAVRAIGNVVTGDDVQTDVVIEAGLLPKAMQLLSDPESKRGIRKETLWGLSNIAAGNRKQVQALLDTPGLMETVIGVVANESTPDLPKEALWVICNALSSGNEDTHRRLGELGAVSALCTALQGDAYRQLKGGALEGLTAIFQTGGIKSYIRYAGECLTDPTAFLSDLGIGSEAVIEFIGTHDAAASAQQEGPLFPVFVTLPDGSGSTQVEVPSTATVGELAVLAAEHLRAQGFAIQPRPPPEARNKFVPELQRCGADDTIREVTEAQDDRICQLAVEFLRDFLDEDLEDFLEDCEDES